jgi:glycerol-3-phosphate dehydrogenase (NAD(P)+)
MNNITVFGAGAFGTALAISLANDGRPVSLVARNSAHAAEMSAARSNQARLPGVALPASLRPVHDIPDPSDVCLIAVPMQSLSGFLAQNARVLDGRHLIACCKGVDLTTGDGPSALIDRYCPTAVAAVLSGPSFATDIAAGLPTALTLATKDVSCGTDLQGQLSTANLRLYRSSDVIGVEMGGALKNVVAIAAGIAIGAGLGESARAALITRGYSEMIRFAVAFGARAQTLAGLSGFGDLVLTATSTKSRNYTYGLCLGGGETPAKSVTVEGVATAKAVSNIAKSRDIDMPLTDTVTALLEGKITVNRAIDALMSRPLKEE